MNEMKNAAQTSLRSIKFSTEYRTGYNNIMEEFFHPSLDIATEYWRAVGYFSSSSLDAFGSPLGTFIRNGGTVKLITSVHLHERDLDAIEIGRSRQEICEERINEIIENEFVEASGNGTARLAHLLQMGKLEIRIAVPTKGTGIYHEKIGLFFKDADFIAFTGSMNETRSAFENNQECIDLFTSWGEHDFARANRKKSHFERLWNGEEMGVEVFSFPEAARKKMIKIYSEKKKSTMPTKEGHKVVCVATEEEKWKHQDEACEVFIHKEQGILNMATGTGKTYTALKIIRKLCESNKIDTIIVCTDGNDLLDQWHKEIHEVGRDLGFNVYRNYRRNQDIDDFLLSMKRSILLVSLPSKPKNSALSRALHKCSAELGDRTLIVYDEVHQIGSDARRKALNGCSDNIRFKLGLSATPMRTYDGEGNEFIEEHVGPEIFEFGLEDAIRRGILVPFNYYPLSYEITDSDRKRIQAVYKKQAALKALGTPMQPADLWTELAKVYKTSEGKLPVFKEFVADNEEELERCIVFVESRNFGEKVIEIIHQYRADFHTYYTKEKSETLKRFARQDLECLITCHRVSEGIDIKSLNSVIIFSSARSRLETIQRIGRCLRSDPENPEKIASVVDFIRVSSGDKEENADELRKKWLTEVSKIRMEKVN